MSNNWYPIIDYRKCTECGICIENCGNGVYDLKKAPTPDIIFGEGCYEGCHGCGNLCPVGAITYIGENTDWKPM